MTASRGVVLITGAGSGIGRATSLALARASFAVALVGRRQEALEDLAAFIDDDTAGAARTLVLAADVSDPAQAAGAVNHAAAHFGRLDALVNNAGSAPLAPIDQTTPDMLQDCYAVNALGPAYLICAAWPIFKRQADDTRMQHAEPRATIVNVSSMATRDPFPGFFAYAGAKAALNVMARSCAKEGAAIGVRAFAVAPGAVETPMLRANFPQHTIPPASTLAPEVVADIILSCIRAERDADNGEVIWIPSP